MADHEDIVSHAVRISLVEAKTDTLEKDVDELDDQMMEVQLLDREMKTNWRLAMTLGGFGGTLLVALIIFIGTH